MTTSVQSNDTNLLVELEEEQIMLREKLRIQLEEQQVKLKEQLEQLERKTGISSSLIDESQQQGVKLPPIIKKRTKKKRKKVSNNSTSTDGLVQLTESESMTIAPQIVDADVNTKETPTSSSATSTTPREYSDFEVQTVNSQHTDTNTQTESRELTDRSSSPILPEIITNDCGTSYDIDITEPIKEFTAIEIQTDQIERDAKSQKSYMESEVQTDHILDISEEIIEEEEKHVPNSVVFEELSSDSTSLVDVDGYVVEETDLQSDPKEATEEVIQLQEVDDSTEEIPEVKIEKMPEKRFTFLYSHWTSDDPEQNARISPHPQGKLATRLFFSGVPFQSEQPTDPMSLVNVTELMKEFKAKTVTSLFNIKNALDSMDEAVTIALKKKVRGNLLLRLQALAIRFKDAKTIERLLKDAITTHKTESVSFMGDFGTEIASALFMNSRDVSNVLRSASQTARIAPANQSLFRLGNTEDKLDTIIDESANSLARIPSRFTIFTELPEDITALQYFKSIYAHIQKWVMEETSNFIFFPNYKGARLSAAALAKQKELEREKRKQQRRELRERERDKLIQEINEIREKRMSMGRVVIRRSTDSESDDSSSSSSSSSSSCSRKSQTETTEATDIQSQYGSQVIMIVRDDTETNKQVEIGTDDNTNTQQIEKKTEYIYYLNGRVCTGRSFGIIPASNPIRRILFRIFFSKLAILAMYLIILLNFILSAIKPSGFVNGETLSRKHKDYKLYKFVEGMETAFLSIYTMEAVCKIFALGFFVGKHTYLRRTMWNLLDLLVIVVGWVDMLAPTLNASPTSIRALRMFKPLLSLSLLSGIDAMFEATVRSVLQMRDNFFFLVVLTLLFGIIGVEYYKTAFTTRCTILENGDYVDVYPPRFCSLTDKSFSCPGAEMVCQAKLSNLYHANFNNLPAAIFAILSTLTYSNYNADLMYRLNTSSNRALTVLFFVAIILAMSFVVLNLFVAIVSSAFSLVRNKQSALRAKRKRDFHKMKTELMGYSSVGQAAKKGFDVESVLGYDEDLIFFPQLRFIWWRWNKNMKKARLAAKRRNQHSSRTYSRSEFLLLFSLRKWVEKFEKLQMRIAYRIANNIVFDWITYVFVVACVAFYATQSAKMTERHKLVITIVHHVLFIETFFEIIIRILGAKTIFYCFTDIYMIIDVTLFLYSLVAPIFGLHVRILYMRVIRTIKVTRTVPLFKIFVDNSLKGMYTVLSLLFFIAIILLQFAIFSKQLYGGMIPDDDLPRENFNTIGIGMLTFLKIMTADDWLTIIYTYIDIDVPGGKAKASRYKAVSPLFFVFFFFFSTFVILNIFTAVILENFELDDEKKQEIQETEFYEKRLNIPDHENLKSFINRIVNLLLRKGKGRIHPVLTSIQESNGNGDAANNVEDFQISQSEARFLSDENDKDQATLDTDRNRPDAANIAEEEKQSAKEPEETTLRRSVMRYLVRAAGTVHRHFVFQGMMFFVSILMIFLLCLEPSAEADKQKYSQKLSGKKMIAATVLEWMFFGLQLLEFALKTVHKGLIGYAASFLNSINFVALLCTLVCAVLNLTTRSDYITIIRCCRFLLVFRIIQYVQVLRVVKVRRETDKLPARLKSLLADMVIIGVFISLILIIFCVLGMELFAGKFYYCNDPTIQTKDECTGLFTYTSIDDSYLHYGLTIHRKWTKPKFNFDGFFRSIFTLIQIASFDGWTQTMYNAMDITEIGKQPKPGNSPWNCIFFIVYVIVGGFYIINLIIGVILQRINERRGLAYLTDHQRNWMIMKAEILVLKPEPLLEIPKNRVKAAVFHLIQSKTFESLITFSILLNVSLIASQHMGETDKLVKTIKYANYAFVVIFLIEAVLKIIGWGPFKYIFNIWNVYDLSVLFISIVATCIEIAVAAKKSNRSTLMWISEFGTRICYIMKVPRLISQFDGVKYLLNSLISGLNNIVKIILIMICIMCVYAAMGMKLFGNVKYQQYFNSSANFRSFPSAMLVLLRMLTMDDWTKIVQDSLDAVPPFCTKTKDFSDCAPNNVITTIYFISFFLLGSLVILNLVIAIVMDNFAHCYTKGKSFVLDSDHLMHFKKCWQKYDPYGVGAIKPSDLKKLVQQLFDEKNTILGFDVKRNRLLFKILYYQAINKIEGTKDELAGNFMNYDLAILQNDDGETLESFGKVIKFHDVLLLLAKYGVDQKCFTLEERMTRMDSIQLALQHTCAQTIQKFLRNIVWLKKTLITLKRNGGFFDLGQSTDENPVRQDVPPPDIHVQNSDTDDSDESTASEVLPQTS